MIRFSAVQAALLAWMAHRALSPDRLRDPSEGSIPREGDGVNRLSGAVARVALLVGISSLSSNAWAQDKYVDSSGVRIHYVERGTGTPVVLLHW